MSQKRCPAALNLEGAHFPCDWPMVDADGRHDGWAHSNKEAQAIWCGNEGRSDARGTDEEVGQVAS